METITDDLFSEYEKENNIDFFPIEIPNENEISIYQKAEVEVNDYLRASRISRKEDPIRYWENTSEKWYMLARLANKFFSAPATSAESERLFSTAGLIVTNLRKKLLPTNVDTLLFLHHNLNVLEFNY